MNKIVEILGTGISSKIMPIGLVTCKRKAVDFELRLIAKNSFCL